jgi:hypothetical protein
MPRTAAAKPKRQPKAVQYAKYAEVGDWVHAKGIHVTSDANLTRWYGSKGSSNGFGLSQGGQHLFQYLRQN